MFKNFLTIAIRNQLRQKGYTLINVLGLAIGIACFLLLFLFVQDEYQYDTFHTQGDRIYQVIRERQGVGQEAVFSKRTSGALGPALVQDFPNIEQAIRVWKWSAWSSYQDKSFKERIVLADPNFFDFFTFKFELGNAGTALSSPNTVVITQSVAQKYFGDESPLGKTLTLQQRYLGGDYTVTGVLSDLPKNSTVQFDLVTSTVSQATYEFWDKWMTTQGWLPVDTYVMLSPGYDVQRLAQQLPEFMRRYMGEDVEKQNTYHLQPFLRMYLFFESDFNIPGFSKIHTVYLFMSIAIFILVIACINFMNLATARSVKRAKEVGIRKVVGAFRFQLIGQFLGESVFLSLIALVLALGLAESALPAFNVFCGKELSLLSQPHVSFLIGLIVLALCVGCVAGSYPAFFLSRFQPTDVLKDHRITGGNSWLRKGLVVFQFSISALLIVSTLVIHYQLHFMTHKRLGFKKENIVHMPIFLQSYSSEKDPTKRLSAKYRLVRDEFLKHPNITDASAFRAVMGESEGGFIRTVQIEGTTEREQRIRVQEADENFLRFYNIPLVKGNNFLADRRSSEHAFMLNETAVRTFGLEDPVGKRIKWGDREGIVVGVTEDYHFASLRNEIEPYALYYGGPSFISMGLKIRSENVHETMAFIGDKWRQFVPGRPFEFSFLEDSLNQLYHEEQRLRQMATVFALIAIFVNCLGLFGLVSYTCEQRKKEIGIRKIIGASESQIVFLLSKDFLRLLVCANLIAFPVAYLVMQDWLQSFAYRIDMGVWIFALGGLVTCAIALVTLGYKSLAAARANLIDVLRNE